MVSNQVTSRCISRSALLISALAACSGRTSTPTFDQTPSLILYNADVRTMDPNRPAATALAIAGGNIVAVGNDAEIRKLAKDKTRQLDLAGKTVTPGLIDAHCHLYGLGVDLENISVRGLDSEQAVVAKLVAEAKTRLPGEWVIGRGWDQNRWPGQQFPTKASLDAAFGDRAVLLRRVDGHAAWVNTKALALASITRDSKDPSGGKIERDAAGEPTGVLIDNAIDLVDQIIPTASAAVRERRIRAGAKAAIAAGITGVHDMGIDDATAEIYRKLAGANELPLRVYAYLAGDPGNLDRVRVAPQPAIGWFQMRGVKYFADGALGSRGARLYKEYDDDPKNKGLWVTEPDKLKGAVDAAVSGGWQVAIHAIGDAGVGSVIDAYLAANTKHGGDHRLRIEHLQIIAPDDIPRLVESKAIASMQPTHATSDMPWAEQRIGAERIKGAYAWRTVLDKGVPLAAGSDFPVEEVSPILGLYAAVTRQDPTGKPETGWYAAQKLTLDEAIAAFTRGSAYAEFAENSRGMIAVGREADVTVFDRKLAPDRSLLETRAMLTIVGGRVVHEAGGP
jgi:predicted amidohydrolase YtcJ